MLDCCRLRGTAVHALVQYVVVILQETFSSGINHIEILIRPPIGNVAWSCGAAQYCFFMHQPTPVLALDHYRCGSAFTLVHE